MVTVWKGGVWVALSLGFWVVVRRRFGRQGVAWGGEVGLRLRVVVVVVGGGVVSGFVAVVVGAVVVRVVPCPVVVVVNMRLGWRGVVWGGEVGLRLRVVIGVVGAVVAVVKGEEVVGVVDRGEVDAGERVRASRVWRRARADGKGGEVGEGLERLRRDWRCGWGWGLLEDMVCCGGVLFCLEDRGW